MMSLVISLFLLLIHLASSKGIQVETILKNGIDFVKIAQQISQDGNNLVSQPCSEQIRYLFKNKNALFEMADAWSKFPYPGAFYYASKSDWGNYDECIQVSVENDTIFGKFCPWGLEVPTTESTVYLLAYCVPQKCSAQDLNNVTGLTLFNERFCSTKHTDREIDKEAIIAIIIFGLIFVCVVWSTSYDVYLYYSGKKSLSPYFVTFSIYSNGKKLLQFTRTSREGDQILCFYGMRFISMWWIISSHGAVFYLLAPLMNEDKRAYWQQKQYTQYIMSAQASFDTVFYISGFLQAYLYFKQDLSRQPLKQQIKKIPKIVIHRYIRMFLPNAMCFLGIVFLFKYLQNGPFFSYGVHNSLIGPCKRHWWTYFLYIQNYYNFHYDQYLCIPTSWYLSADFQLFVFASVVLVPLSFIYRKSFKKTMITLAVLNVIFFCIPIFIRLQWRNYDPNFQQYDTHSKLISYFIGIMAGVYVRYKKNKKVYIGKIANLSLWFLSLSAMMAVVFYRQRTETHGNYVDKTLCYSFTKLMWCLALVWITYSCTTGYGGVVNWLLSSRFMQLGGKLTYCLYIVHGMVIDHSSLGLRNRLYFSDWHIFYQNCGHFIVSMLIATFWSLSYEWPVLNIQKLASGNEKPKIAIPRAKLRSHSIKYA